MSPTEHPVCGVRGRLADADVIKLQNLAMPGGIYNWEDQELACELPQGHGSDHHVQSLATQDFGQADQIWWASWLDIDGLRDEAAMFTGPVCNATLEGTEGPEGERPVWGCLLLAGHTTPNDRRHIMR
jgi:hypothetical protein